MNDELMFMLPLLLNGIFTPYQQFCVKGFSVHNMQHYMLEVKQNKTNQKLNQMNNNRDNQRYEKHVLVNHGSLSFDQKLIIPQMR